MIEVQTKLSCTNHHNEFSEKIRSMFTKSKTVPGKNKTMMAGSLLFLLGGSTFFGARSVKLCGLVLLPKNIHAEPKNWWCVSMFHFIVFGCKD